VNSIVYAIYYLYREHQFEAGYCVDYEIRGSSFIIHEPFSQQLMIVPLGVIICRSKWDGKNVLPRSGYDIEAVAAAPWMEYDAADLDAVIQLCRKCTTTLPEDGFRRL
jgi:N-acetyl-anhydromuramyl-L-alanine amidase AmpD